MADGEVHIAVVSSILHILEEALHDWHGDHVADILGDIAGVALEGDADDFSVLHDGAAAVAGVDGGVDLDREVRVHSGVRVGLEIDAGNDAAGDGEARAADGVAIDGDDGFEGGKAAEFEGGGAVEEFDIFDLEEREIAIVRDVENAGGIGLRVALFGNGEEARVADDMGVRHDAVAVDHKPRANAGEDFSAGPRGFVVGLLGGGLDADEALGDRGGDEESR